uniref:Uncharacterized protein n=1 Tax=Sphaerodactylus townsendi TaxID=933632 RepID=A0ACB8ETF5_9SAUR
MEQKLSTLLAVLEDEALKSGIALAAPLVEQTVLRRTMFGFGGVSSAHLLPWGSQAASQRPVDYKSILWSDPGEDGPDEWCWDYGGNPVDYKSSSLTDLVEGLAPSDPGNNLAGTVDINWETPATPGCIGRIGSESGMSASSNKTPRKKDTGLNGLTAGMVAAETSDKVKESNKGTTALDSDDSDQGVSLRTRAEDGRECDSRDQERRNYESRFYKMDLCQQAFE